MGKRISQSEGLLDAEDLLRLDEETKKSKSSTTRSLCNIGFVLVGEIGVVFEYFLMNYSVDAAYFAARRIAKKQSKPSDPTTIRQPKTLRGFQTWVQLRLMHLGLSCHMQEMFAAMSLRSRGLTRRGHDLAAEQGRLIPLRTYDQLFNKAAMDTATMNKFLPLILVIYILMTSLFFSCNIYITFFFFESDVM